MSVTLNIASYLQPYTDNQETVIVEGKTVRECLKHLVEQHSGIKEMLFEKNGSLLDYVSIFVGGEISYSDQLDQPVKEGDILHVLYLIGGG